MIRKLEQELILKQRDLAEIQKRKIDIVSPEPPPAGRQSLTWSPPPQEVVPTKARKVSGYTLYFYA